MLTTGCATSYDPLFAGLPNNLDAGVGQLMRYCSKFQNSGDLVTAAGLCERAHQMEPANPVPLMQLAEILKGIGRPAQAMAAYRTIIATNPRYTDARYALSKMHIARGEYDTAAAQLQTALRHKTDDPRLYNALGVAQGLIGANESAMEAFKAGLKIAPRHISLRNNMGLALVMNGYHDEGVRILEAVAADPAADDTSYHNLQLAYGMVTAANIDAEAAAAELAVNGVSQESMAPVEPVTVATNSQVAVAAKPAAGGSAPVPLVPELELERVFATTGEIETPIQVTPWDKTVAANTAGSSLLRVQTAKVITGEAMDADVEIAEVEIAAAPSAYLGAYLTVDADITAPADTATAPKASQIQAAPQAAAVQPIVPAVSGGDYAVQLASYLSEARAMLGWTELRGTAPDLLDSIAPVVRRADLDEDRGTVYRLRTSPTAKSDAATLCTELKARGIDCLLVKEAPSETQVGSHA